MRCLRTTHHHFFPPFGVGLTMKIREFLNQNSSIGILAAVVLLVISLFIIYRQISGGGRGPQTIRRASISWTSTPARCSSADIQAVHPSRRPPALTRASPRRGGQYLRLRRLREELRGHDHRREISRPERRSCTSPSTPWKTSKPSNGCGTRSSRRRRNPPEEELYYSELIADVSAEPLVLDGNRHRSADALDEDMPDCPEDKPLKQCYPGRK